MEPLVSVVITTRNRIPFLTRLLDCVHGQDLENFECLVIDDGSSEESWQAYQGLFAKLDRRFLLHRRAANSPGGPSRARNRGISLARGRYVAFCDDDDLWVRRDHLSTAAAALQRHRADLYFAAMQMASGDRVTEPDLYAPARNALERYPLENGIYDVRLAAMAHLLRHRTLHTDSIVASRSLLQEAGLYWEKTSLAEDRDFSFRLADRARKILFRATVSASLEVSPHASLYRTYAAREKALWSYLASLHSELNLRNERLRRTARAVRAWDLVDLAKSALQNGNRAAARALARESVLLHPSLGAVRLYFKAC